jgi:hypothetical protein
MRFDPLAMYKVCARHPGLTGVRGGAPFVDSEVVGPVGGAMAERIYVTTGGSLHVWPYDPAKRIVWVQHRGECVPRYEPAERADTEQPDSGRTARTPAKPRRRRRGSGD